MVVQTNRPFGRVVAIGATAAMACASLVAAPIMAQAQSNAQVSAKKDVQVIAFQQTWNTIAKECAETYGPEGVGYVEVSPPQESIQGTQWWTSYQPVSYKLDSKLGTEAEFASMIKQCSAAGVNVIADVVLNQTTGSDVAKGEQAGVAGSKYNGSTGDYPGFATKQYPDGITAADFHSCDKNISNYTNQQEVQECRLSSMWDFNSENEKVQDIQSDYLVKLWNLGVRGFRMDAVKHIHTDSMKAIKEKFAKKIGQNANDIYWIQEVIGNSSEAAGIQPGNYVQNGTVTEFGFKSEMNQYFKDKVAKLKGLNERLSKDLASKDANVFVTNWDTARNQGALTYKDGAKYQLANAFMLAYDYGTPRLLSDYKWDVNDNGAPGATATSVPDVDMDKACSTNDSDWNCEQRWTSTRGMIAFHNYVGDAEVTDWQDDGGDNIAFSRDDRGFIAINNGKKEKDVTYTTSLADGEYCDVYATMDCSKTVTVKGGKVETKVPARSAIALYAGATKASHPAASTATDPSDPDVSKIDDEVTATDKTITIYYKPADSTWKTPKVHYGLGDDWNQPEADMTLDEQGYYRATIDTKGKKIDFVFHDADTDQWENPDGGGNYHANAGIIQVGVAGQELSIGNPESVGQKTRLVVHYKPAKADDRRGVYVWGTSTDGTDITATNHPFTGTDCWGKVATLDFDGEFTDFGFIITTEDWNKYGGDRKATVNKTGTAEVWIDGTKNEGKGESTTVETLDSAPADYNCKADTVNVTVHYYRDDGLYYNAKDTKVTVPQWDIWTWSSNWNGGNATFDSHDDWGEVAKYSVPNYTYSNADGNSDIGMLRRYGSDAWASKDPDDANHMIPSDALVFDADGNASAEVWLVGGDPTVYSSRPSLKIALKSAEISDFKELTARLSKKPADGVITKAMVAVKDADGNKVDVEDVTVNKSTVKIKTAKKLAVTGKYTIEIEGMGSQTAIAGALVRTDAFDKAYAYDGDDLGATFKEARTGFKVWAPTATKVELVIYKSTDPNAEVDKTIDMTGEDKGVWSATVKKLASGTAYSYKLTFADGTVNTSSDPYATAAVANGERSVVLSKEDMGSAGKRMPAFGKTTDATIAEMNIRDFSINPNSGISADKQGKYLGVVESGTKTKEGATSGLDYLKQLGISHVQIMPMYDYGSVDETGDLSYNANGAQNWGYDPENYNVPEGSYSSNPSNPSSRVAEMKQMVKELHKNDIRVIMDVVYNHVYNAANHSFNKTVPGYYFRYDANGSLVNNSGCGNDTASERKMMRKYIVDSVTYWAKNYNVDGFRFDLMGLIDTETMKEVRAALDKIDPSIIILGEGWDMNTTMDKSKMTIQPNAYQVASDGKNNGIAFFNDSIRDGLKGSVFDSADTGFVSGKAGQEKLIAHNALGCQYDAEAETTCWNGNAQDHYADAGQVVNYAEIHDNLTLYDKLKASVPTDDEATTVARAKLADSVVYLSEGIPATQLGQEFLRTKGGNGNSYNAGDAANAIDWNRAAQYADSVDYVKGLIKLRKQIKALRLTNYDDINDSVTMLKSDEGVVAYQAKDSSGTYMVIFNANNEPAAVEGIGAGKYNVLAGDGTVYDENAKDAFVRKGSTYTAGALSATVLKVASADDVVPVISGMTESTTITVGSKFDSMAGVTADDSIDGDLTDGIKVEGTVDAGKVGDYKLVYSVSNSRGKTTTFTRTVHVQKKVVVPTAEANAASGKKNENASRAQSPATGSNVMGLALAIAALVIAAGALIVSHRKEVSNR
ncbi:type I pullulanase [Bifidobacterium adolescentis]|uniref:Alpha-amylase n=1 Tax=Bifidobacterium adolescentis TaxID=1680 RepID=A0A1E7Y014_BIFAD|nr:type I pullulanase [Bifidobacterium adolescentis]OFA34906.1 type I pullulanase [Bifidobacterium adolescentis]